MRLKVKFTHQHIYPAWRYSLMDDREYAALQQSQSRLNVAVTQLARWLGLTGSLNTGSVTYLLDKKKHTVSILSSHGMWDFVGHSSASMNAAVPIKLAACWLPQRRLAHS